MIVAYCLVFITYYLLIFYTSGSGEIKKLSLMLDRRREDHNATDNTSKFLLTQFDVLYFKQAKILI